MIKYLENEDFNEIIKDKKVLVDFYADWCGPCKMLGEVLETIDSIDIIKINTDKHQELAFSFGVMSIPTIVIMDNGKEVARNIGLLSASELEDFINQC